MTDIQPSQIDLLEWLSFQCFLPAGVEFWLHIGKLQFVDGERCRFTLAFKIGRELTGIGFAFELDAPVLCPQATFTFHIGKLE